MIFTIIDGIDIKILKALSADGRISNTDLSERIHLSQTPTYKRVKRLEGDGYITGYKAILDESKLGGRMAVFTWVSLANQKKESLQAFEELVRDAPEVMDCFLMTGDADYLLRIVVDNLYEFESFLTEKMARLGDINSIKSSFALRRIVQKSIPPKLSQK